MNHNKESNEKIIKITQLETMINTNNTARISKDEELKREIDDVVKTVALELKTKFTEFQTKVSDVNTLIAKLDNKNDKFRKNFRYKS